MVYLGKISKIHIGCFKKFTLLSNGIKIVLAIEKVLSCYVLQGGSLGAAVLASCCCGWCQMNAASELG